MPCPVCVEGRLTRRENRQSGGIFYGCSNYPYCEHRQRPCPDCGKGLVVKADRRVPVPRLRPRPLSPAPGAAAGSRPGWASTAASWAARVFPRAATPGILDRNCLGAGDTSIAVVVPQRPTP